MQLVVPSHPNGHEIHPAKRHLRGPDAPHETVLSTALGDGAVDGGTRALVERVDTGIDAPGHVERCDTIEVVARVVVNVGEEPIRVKRRWFTILRNEWFRAPGIKGFTNVSPRQGGSEGLEFQLSDLVNPHGRAPA